MCTNLQFYAFFKQDMSDKTVEPWTNNIREKHKSKKGESSTKSPPDGSKCSILINLDEWKKNYDLN